MTFRLSIMARELTNALAANSTVSDTGVKIPVLKATHIQVVEKFAIMTATNTDQTVSCRAACDGDGIAVLDTAMLLAKSQACKQDAPINFSGDGKFVTATQGRAKWVMPCLAIDSFPIQAADKIDAPEIEMSAKYLVAALGDALAGIDAKSPGTNSVFFDFFEGLRIWGRWTGGMHISQVAEFQPTEFRNFALTEQSAQQIGSLFKSGDTTKIRASENAVSIESGGIWYRSKLADAQPAAYRTFVNLARPNSVTFDAGEFRDALKRTLAIADDGKSLKMTMRIDGDITLSAINVDGEESSDFVKGAHSGEPVEFIFPHTRLKSAIDTLNCASVRLDYIDKTKPACLSAVGASRENLRFIMSRYI